MHPDTYSARYQPTSPLSPRISLRHGSVSPSAGRSRATYSSQSNRGFRLALPTYSGTSARASLTSPPSAAQSPVMALHRTSQPTPMESPRLMREKQKELIARAQLSSKLAASPMANKPDAPRLDPLDGPKGPVTPLALEEQAADYFTVAGASRFSPVGSPGARSARSNTPSSGKEEMGKRGKVEMY